MPVYFYSEIIIKWKKKSINGGKGLHHCHVWLVGRNLIFCRCHLFLIFLSVKLSPSPQKLQKHHQHSGKKKETKVQKLETCASPEKSSDIILKLQRKIIQQVKWNIGWILHKRTVQWRVFLLRYLTTTK